MPETLKDVVAQLRVRGFFSPSIKEVEDTVGGGGKRKDTCSLIWCFEETFKELGQQIS